MEEPKFPYCEGVTLLYGAPGSGKTTLLLRVIREHLAVEPVVVFDPTGDIARGLKDITPLTFKDTTDFKKHVEWFAFKQFYPGTLVIFTGETDAQKLAFRHIITAKKQYFKCIVCDEAELLFFGEPITTYLSALYTSRNKGVAIYLATKRPTHIHTTVRSCAIRSCVFKLISDRDVLATDTLGPRSLYAEVQDLDTGEYLYRDTSMDQHTVTGYDNRVDELPWKIERDADHA